MHEWRSCAQTLRCTCHCVQEFIRKTLEKQLNEMRKTRVVGIGKDGGGGPVLGDPDKPFSFAGMRNRVLLCEMSAKLGGDKLEDVAAFVAACSR